MNKKIVKLIIGSVVLIAVFVAVVLVYARINNDIKGRAKVLTLYRASQEND